MLELLKRILKNMATTADNETYSMTKTLIALPAAYVGMWKFATSPTPDLTAFGVFIGAMIATLAFKNSVDK